MCTFALQITAMLLFVKQYKQEVLGVGEVALPGESAALKEAGMLRTAKESGQPQGHTSASGLTPAADGSNGTDGMTQYVSESTLVLLKNY